MEWARDLQSWPYSEHSERVRVRPHEWHFQQIGTGPLLLLLHGAGATTHSWRDLVPMLSQTHRIVMLDLPGHGFTRVGSHSRMGLESTAEDIAALCADQGWTPVAVIGHSAGAALALDLAAQLSGATDVVGINAALDRFEGMASWLFPMLAKLLAMNPLTAMAFAAGGARPDRARNVIRATGSSLSDEGLAYYSRLLSDRAHVDGTLQTMARWNTDALWDRLPAITNRTLFITGAKDSAVSPRVSDRAAAVMPNAERQTIETLGHLAHEEDPDQVGTLILDWLSARQAA